MFLNYLGCSPSPLIRLLFMATPEEPPLLVYGTRKKMPSVSSGVKVDLGGIRTARLQIVALYAF
jgi:hypothetical protein